MAKKYVLSFLVLSAIIFLPACVPSPGITNPGETRDGKLRLVATTTIVADVVRNVAGDAADVVSLLPPGTDPHGFEPAPQDIALVSEADLVFANGAGLEEFLNPLIESAGADNKVVQLSDGITLIQPTSTHDLDEGDPHTWTDPNNVIGWIHSIESVLSGADPENASLYGANSAVYLNELLELDDWIREKVSVVPEVNRLLVTDHQVFAYFAEQYGFIQTGTLIPGYSSMSEPSAQALAEIEDAIKGLSVQAVFVGNTVNPDLALRVAEDTGTQLVFVYTGSLSDNGGEAETYLEYVRYNVNAIVDALK